MSAYSAIAQGLAAHFYAHVTSGLGYATQWDGEEFRPPRDDEANTPWLRHHILWFGQQQATTSGTRWRVEGEVIVTVFVPLDSGAGVSEEIADQIVDIYRGATVGSVHFTTAELRQVGEGSGWWQANIHMPFYADEVS